MYICIFDSCSFRNKLSILSHGTRTVDFPRATHEMIINVTNYTHEILRVYRELARERAYVPGTCCDTARTCAISARSALHRNAIAARNASAKV